MRTSIFAPATLLVGGGLAAPVADESEFSNRRDSDDIADAMSEALEAPVEDRVTEVTLGETKIDWGKRSGDPMAGGGNGGSPSDNSDHPETVPGSQTVVTETLPPTTLTGPTLSLSPEVPRRLPL